MKRKLTSISITLIFFIGTTITLAQSSNVSWSTFNMGFAVSVSPNTSVKSAVGQTFVGTSEQANTIIESGFLADTLQRGPLLAIGDETGLPITFSLGQNYPNPFNPVTTLQYDLPENSFVNITIYDLLGREVRTLVKQSQEAGFKTVLWNATNDNGKPVSAGVYLYQIQAGEFIQTRKMILLR